MSEFSALVLAWFEQHGRKDLPWQQDINAYRVWVSEIMLQQTQVKTVIPYFQRFMQRFPDIFSLAAAPLDEVLAFWAGLGYYSRAKHLHQAAIMTVAQFNGQLPDTVEALSTLPGIGQSTAGAIISIAYQKPAAILDGNVKRVLSRVYAVEGSPNDTSVQKKLWQIARQNTPEQQTANYTQAMMDLGATLCTRSKPDCQRCPLKAQCVAYQTNTIALYPEKKAKKVLPVKQTTMLLIQAENEILLCRRPALGIWPNLFSLIESDNSEAFCQQHFAPIAFSQTPFCAFRHTFSHYHLQIAVELIQLAKKPLSVRQDEQWHWVKLDEALASGIPAPIRKILKQLEKHYK